MNEEEFQIGLDDYYSVRGWTPDGIPTLEKLAQLDLGNLAHIVQQPQGGA